MLDFRAGFFCSNTMHLQHLMDDVAQDIRERGNDALITADEETRARSVIDRLTPDSESLFLQRTIERLGRITNTQFDSLTLYGLAFQLEELRNAIWRDLFERTFMHMPRNEAEYFNQPELFGDVVNQKFPKAVEDIKESGNCYATGNNTACVFHLMRVVEHGLRALAKKLRVKFKSSIELETWESIIRAIEGEIQKIINQPKSRKRADDLEFYNGAAVQFRYFKDAWRNHVMHTRTTYDEHQAMSIMVHVREFMQHLAVRLKG